MTTAVAIAVALDRSTPAEDAEVEAGGSEKAESRATEVDAAAARETRAT